MKIREYKKLDKENVLNLIRLNIPKFFDYYEEKDLTNYLDNEIDRYFVVEENDQIVGSGGFNHFKSEKEIRISWDIFHPDYQNKGLGTLLLEHRIKEIKTLDNVEKIIVRTSQHAYKFYEKNNFKLIEINKDYWAKGFDMYLMEYLG